MQVILAQVACDLPTQDGCSWHRVSSALYNGLLGQRASYAAVCEDDDEVGGPIMRPHLHRCIRAKLFGVGADR